VFAVRWRLEPAEDAQNKKWWTDWAFETHCLLHWSGYTRKMENISNKVLMIGRSLWKGGWKMLRVLARKWSYNEFRRCSLFLY
jgi:hypothetical protein